MKKTKILCTIGPSSASKVVQKRMYEAGMDGVRINTAFGDLEEYERVVKSVRSIGEIPVLLDLKGPELRIMVLESRFVRDGEVLELGFDYQPIHLNYDIFDQIDVGDPVLIDGGRIQTEVVEKKDRRVQLLIKNGGVLEDRKGVNIPGKTLELPFLTEKDLRIIDFAKKHEVEFIALSFTRSREDILNLRSKIGDFDVGIIAKIESQDGVKNFNEILDEADGIMVARGDLGVELSLEELPLIQKRMIRQCNQFGKLVITATEMLESMVKSPRPTRAEVSDVANAILDGTDVIMFSEETSIGKYPVETVMMAAKIAEQTEAAVVGNVKEEEFQDISRSISRSIWQISESMPIDKVVALTRSGYTARMISRFRLKQPILAVTPSRTSANRLSLSYGVYPTRFDYMGEKDHILSTAGMLLSKGLIKSDERILFSAGFRTYTSHESNLIEIHKVDDLMQFIKGEQRKNLQG